jgi:hypothetical protein
VEGKLAICIKNLKFLSFFLSFFWWHWGLNSGFRASLFALVIFQLESCVFAWASLRLRSSYLCLPCSWDHRQYYHAYWDGVSTNFLPRLASNQHPPNLYRPSSLDYRCEPLHLAPLYFWHNQEQIMIKIVCPMILVLEVHSLSTEQLGNSVFVTT